VKNRGLLVLVLIYLCGMLAIFKPWIHGRDGAAYYAWLRSAVIDRDLDTYNEIHHFEEIQTVAVQMDAWRDNPGRTQTGYWINHWPVGSAVLWSPFFLLAHVAAKTLNLAGFAIPADGYSSLYVWLTMFGSTVWAFLALYLLYRVATQVYDGLSATLSTISIWLASPLVFYMFMYPTMSHANDAFANALFIWLWYRSRKARDYRHWLLLGLAAGLAGLVRTQNVLLLAFPGLELLWALFEAVRQRSSGRVKHVFAQGSLFGSAFLLAFAPQMLVWKTVYGSYIVLNAVKMSMGLGFDLRSPHFFDVLLSSNRGLFIWHPILLLAVLGVGFLARRERRLAVLLWVSFLLQLYLVGSYDAWDSSPAFGARYFVNTLPLFILGLSGWTNWLRKRIPLGPVAAIWGLFVVWNFALIVQYSLQLVPRAGPISISQMVYNQFVVVPQRLGQVLILMLSRLSW